MRGYKNLVKAYDGPIGRLNGQVKGHNGGYEKPHELPCSLICSEYPHSPAHRKKAFDGR